MAQGVERVSSEIEEAACRAEETEPIPYQFEPLRAANLHLIREISSDPTPLRLTDNRSGNTDWCTCGHCQVMTTQVESVCCAECPRIWKKVVDQRDQSVSEKDSQAPSCITESAGFEPVCLNPFVLETAYLQFKQEHGMDLETSLHEKYRYTGYRQLVRWCYGFLGRNIRVPLPSCAVSRIRNEYPSDGHTYKGFKWPSL